MSHSDAVLAGSVAGGLTLLFVAFSVVASVRSTRARMPRGIVRRLRAHPGQAVTVSATGIMGNPGVWNPAGTGYQMWLYQRGVATYRLGEDGQVQLDWRSAGQGQRSFVGPPLPDADHSGDNRTVLWTILIFGLVGLGSGYLYGLTAHTADRRVAWTLAGLLVAAGLLGLVELLLVRRHKRASTR